MPLENNMKTPESFLGTTGVLNKGMFVVVCLYSAFGFFGYLKFGDKVDGSITLNLPQTDKLVLRISSFLASSSRPKNCCDE